MNNQSEEKKEIPTPPPSKVNVRTMQSDIKSIQESGGQNPQPYMTEINQQKKETSAPEELSFQPSELGSNIPGYVGPEEPIFKPGVPIAPLPPQQKPNKPEEAAKPPKKGSKTLIIIILTILVLAAIILGVGYYLTRKEEAINATPSLTTPPEDQAVIPPAAILKPAYVSLFKTPNVLEEQIITALNLENIKNALTAAASTAPANTLKEVVLRNTDDSLIVFSKFIPILLPELKSEEMSGIFEENFSAVIFADKNGVWPGYVIQLKPTTTLDQAQTFIKNNLESSTNLKNIFIEDPGLATAIFKDGKAGSPAINTRYLVFSKTGAAINYGWVNNNLVISATYPGLSEILKNLQ